MKAKWHILASAAAILAPTAVWAQDQAAPPPAAPATPGSGVGDIVVTAQRRAENLISVPLSISAQTGTAMLKSGINNLTEVRFNTPGFLAQAGTGYTQIYIRGIGNGVYVGADPSVATFVDDVPHVYGSLVDNLVNVQRVEILKGAQGGLYGRNASGGVINIITRQPSDKLEADVRATGGTRGTFDGSAYVNIPLSDHIAWNVSLTRDWHAPYEKNVAYKDPYPAGTVATVPGTSTTFDPNTLAKPGKLNNENVWAFDTKLRLQVTDNFKITLGGDYANKHDADGNGWLNTTPTATYGTYEYLASLYGITPVAAWPTLNIKSNKAYGAIPNKSWTKDYGGSAIVDWNLPGVDLKSITAYRGNDSQYQGDIGAAPIPIAGFSTNFKRHYFYQELRAVSSGSGPFHWLAGGTYFKDHIDAYINGETLGEFGTPDISQTSTVNWTVYGQVAYDLTDKLSLTTSLRYAHETKTVTFPSPTISATTSVSKPIPAATLSYKLAGGGTVYARYAKGFKTGGPDPLVRPDIVPPGTAGLVIKPETVDTYEIGLKTNLFDRKVQFTSAIFYNNYKNIQATSSGTPDYAASISNALVNLGNAKSYGAEASVNWRVARPLTLSANVGYLHAKYTQADFPGNDYILGIDASHNTMINAPKWMAGFGVNYDQPITDKLRLQANLLYSYISSFNFTALELKSTEQKAYSLVNLRVGVATMNDRLSFSVFADNLFNKRYYVFGSHSAIGDFETPGDPRILGVTVEFKY